MLVRLLRAMAMLVLLFGVPLFLSAGTLRWPEAWGWIALQVAEGTRGVDALQAVVQLRDVEAPLSAVFSQRRGDLVAVGVGGPHLRIERHP